MKLIKVVILLSIVLLISCAQEPIMEDCDIRDCGKTQIGNNIYLKKLNINRGRQLNDDRVYLLVDSTDKLISDITNVSSLDGKVQSTKTFILK